MNRATIERLSRINQEFYDRHARAFSRTRERPWRGWERVITALPTSATLSVLDVGCGNGRLATALAGRFDRIDYLGLDSSAALLNEAARRIGALESVDAQFREIDLVSELPGALVGDRRFDLVAAFGVFHHLPSRDLRLALTIDLARRLEPGGLLAIGFWQFGAHERFRRRFVDWESFNRETRDPVDLDQLEDGDHLLAWGEGADAVRYCHWAPPDEARDLFARAALVAVELYEADGDNGRLNLYLVGCPPTRRSAHVGEGLDPSRPD